MRDEIECNGSNAEEVRALEGFAAAWLGASCSPHAHELEQALQSVGQQLLDAWPQRPPLLEAFWGELARCVPEVSEQELPAALRQLRAVELHLAFACRHGDKTALARFDQRYIQSLDRSIAKIDTDPGFVEDVKQKVRTKLLVGHGSELPKIALYTGRGELSTWLRVVAIREALSSVRSERRRSLIGGDLLDELEASATGPELGLVRRQHAEAFTVAFRTALEDLDPEQRNALRLHYVHGLSIDELASLWSIHRSNAARRIVKIRQELLRRTRRELRTALGLGADEFEQLMVALTSRLDISIATALGGAET